MLVIDARRRTQRIIREVARLPLATRIGLGVMVVAATLDIAFHLLAAPHGAHGSWGVEHTAHVLGIAGTVLVLAGLVTHGARRQFRPRADISGGLDCNAHR